MSEGFDTILRDLVDKHAKVGLFDLGGAEYTPVIGEITATEDYEYYYVGDMFFCAEDVIVADAVDYRTSIGAAADWDAAIIISKVG